MAKSPEPSKPSATSSANSTPLSSPPPSTKSSSSSLSRKAASLHKTIKKGAKAITRPFKKLKRTLSTRSLSSAADSHVNIPSQAGSTAHNEVIELSDDDPDPEKELG